MLGMKSAKRESTVEAATGTLYNCNSVAVTLLYAWYQERCMTRTHLSGVTHTAVCTIIVLMLLLLYDIYSYIDDVYDQARANTISF
jgi:hypothetical protein